MKHELRDRLGSDYDAAVREGSIERDPAQEAVARRLGDLADRLAEPAPPVVSVLSRWFGRQKAAPAAMRGLYLWGAVGRGKTMLMDMFFSVAPLDKKRRVHFHAFMLDVHARIHAWRQHHKTLSRRASEAEGDDPIVPVAAELAREASLLCFDEFAVTDIADAMILGRLFTELFRRDVVVVATSNVEPSRLYENGLNRALFLPFIALLHERMEVVELDAPTDYRYEKIQDVTVYFVPADRRAEASLDRAFKKLTGVEHGRPLTLELLGRELTVPEASGGVARFSFDDLCERPLGAADFLAIGRAFHTVLIDSIPVLAADQRNVVKRFITLIDTFYDLGVKLIVSAAAEPGDLYQAGFGREAQEFERTASRLNEMRSRAYLDGGVRAKEVQGGE